MRRLLLSFIMAVLGLFLTSAAQPSAEGGLPDDAWTASFAVEPGELSATGRNPFFILEPGYRLVFESGEERLTITVLNETQTISGVETRVVEERETDEGELVEVSRNYFAISRKTNSVFYFGEDVDLYRDGEVAGHGGAWRAGESGCRFGLMMPGLVLLGARYYQEIAPEVAMDRAEIISLSELLKTPAGDFQKGLKVEETTPLEPGVKEYKYYAPGIGLVQDGSLKLVKYGKVD